jgi:DNA transformation protein
MTGFPQKIKYILTGAHAGRRRITDFCVVSYGRREPPLPGSRTPPTMARNDAFVEFVCDQLRRLGDVRSRAMFGGHGIYCGDVFFAIVAGGRLYFKTNEQTRRRYVDAGKSFFRPKPDMTLKNYYEVPVDVIEDDDELVAWAREAVKVG